MQKEPLDIAPGARTGHSAPERPSSPGHEEWLIDEALQETFPASDPTSPSQPGNAVASKYRARKEKHKD